MSVFVTVEYNDFMKKLQEKIAADQFFLSSSLAQSAAPAGRKDLVGGYCGRRKRPRPAGRRQGSDMD
jgi:hypothetical protein